MKLTRRGTTWIVLALAAVALLVVAIRGDHASIESRAQAIEQRIKCPVCNGESVAESNSEFAQEVRADVVRRLKAGQSSSQIIDFYVNKRPDDILTPPNNGIGLVAWGIPVLAVVLALVGLGIAFARWRSEPRRVATADDEAVVDEARRA